MFNSECTVLNVGLSTVLYCNDFNKTVNAFNSKYFIAITQYCTVVNLKASFITLQVGYNVGVKHVLQHLQYNGVLLINKLIYFSKNLLSILNILNHILLVSVVYLGSDHVQCLVSDFEYSARPKLSSSTLHMVVQ